MYITFKKTWWGFLILYLGKNFVCSCFYLYSIIRKVILAFLDICPFSSFFVLLSVPVFFLSSCFNIKHQLLILIISPFLFFYNAEISKQLCLGLVDIILVHVGGCRPPLCGGWLKNLTVLLGELVSYWKFLGFEASSITKSRTLVA